MAEVGENTLEGNEQCNFFEVILGYCGMILWDDIVGYYIYSINCEFSKLFLLFFVDKQGNMTNYINRIDA